MEKGISELVMAYQFQWLYEDQIAFVTMSGEFDAEQIACYVKDMLNFLDQSTAEKVHFVESMTDLQKVSMSAIFAAKHGKEILSHPRMGWLVAYGLQSKSVNVVVTMLTQVFRYNFRSVATFEDAIVLLKRQDLTLSDLSELRPPTPEQL